MANANPSAPGTSSVKPTPAKKAPDPKPAKDGKPADTATHTWVKNGKGIWLKVGKALVGNE